MNKHAHIDQLVKRASSGETDAFGELYDIFLDAVYRFVYVRLGNKADAEDITENVFVSMFTAITRYVDKELPFEAWVYRIARNKIIDHYRSRKAHVHLEEIAEIADSHERPEVRLETQMSRETVLRAIKQIPASYQEIIILKFIEDKTNEEISAVLGKPITHIRVLQHRALVALRKVVHYG